MDQKTGQSTSIGFKPLTEGLGLNHFADGLPYSPAHVKKKPTIQFNYPIAPEMPRIAPSERATKPLAQAPVGTKSAQKMIDEFAAPAEELVNASIPRRVMAYLVDLALSFGTFAAIVWISFAVNGFDLSRLVSERIGAQILWPLVLLYGVVHMGYFLVQETTWRCTLGKALFGIRIRSSSGFATVGRAVCFLFSAAPLGIGLLWCLFDQRRRCWHDVITDTEVVRNHETGLVS